MDSLPNGEPFITASQARTERQTRAWGKRLLKRHPLVAKHRKEVRAFIEDMRRDYAHEDWASREAIETLLDLLGD